jgi:hypothetical protein
MHHSFTQNGRNLRVIKLSRNLSLKEGTYPQEELKVFDTKPLDKDYSYEMSRTHLSAQVTTTD